MTRCDDCGRPLPAADDCYEYDSVPRCRACHAAALRALAIYGTEAAAPQTET